MATPDMWSNLLGQKTLNGIKNITTLYNDPRLQFALRQTNSLYNNIHNEENDETSDMQNRFTNLVSNLDSSIRYLSSLQKPVKLTNNSINLAKDIIGGTSASNSAIKSLGNVGKISNFPKSTTGNAATTALSKTVGMATSVLGAAATTAGWGLDIFKNTQSKFNDSIKPYHEINNRNDLNNFKINYTSQKFKPISIGSAAADIAMKTGEGAIAGTGFLPGWGTFGGAVAGTLAGIGNQIAKASTLKKDFGSAANSNLLAYDKGSLVYNDNSRKINSMENRENLLGYSQRRSYADGGYLQNDDIDIYNNGGTHEENPNGGINIGNDNYVEENEVRYKDFIFSNRVTANSDILKKFNCAINRTEQSYAKIAKNVIDGFKDRNDYISNKTLSTLLERLAQAQEYQKISDEADKYGMTPEEYTQYQQQLQEQQAAQEQYQQEEAPVDEQQMMVQQPFYEDVEPQQFAFGGKLLARGGNKSEPGKPPYTGDLYNKPKSNWQNLQEYLEKQFPELQKHRRDIHNFVKSVLSGVNGDMDLAYELTYGGLNDLLFGTSGSNEEFTNALFAAMPFVGKIKGLRTAGKNIVKGVPTKATGQAISHNKAIEKEASIINEMVDKRIASRAGNQAESTANKATQQSANWWNNRKQTLKGLWSPQTKKDKIKSAIAASSLGLTNASILATSGYNDYTKAKEQNDAAKNAIRNSINETYVYNNVPTNVVASDTNSVNTNVYNPPLLFEDPLQTTNNLPQYVAAPNENTAYNPNATLNTNTPTTTKTNPSYRYTENVYGNAYNSSSGNSKYNRYSFPSYISYNEPELENFVARRGDDDTINAFTDAYNKATGKKYTPAQIVKNLSDHKWKDIHEAFYKFIQPDEDIAAEQNDLGDALTQDPDDDLKQYYYPIANIGEDTEESDEPNDDWKTGLYDTARMIPTLGKLRGIFEQEEPDEAYANEILSYYRPTDYNPTGRYKTYSPADQYMLMRQARAQRNALAQQYLANAGGNPAMANYMLAVNDTQYNQDLADNYLKIKQYNDQLRDQALEYNNQLDEANEVRRANTQQANNQLWANLGLPAAAAREQERRDVEEAKYANQESFWNDLATIARERQDRELIRRNPALFYDAWMNYKG